MSTIGELPNLRVKAAWERAEEVGAEHGVSPRVAQEIARAALAEISAGIERRGLECPECHQRTSRERCPAHGLVGWTSRQAGWLLIAFPPVRVGTEATR